LDFLETPVFLGEIKEQKSSSGYIYSVPVAETLNENPFSELR